jgi:hypothetical protein
MAKVLMLYKFAPHTTANYMARALVANGHDVRTAGTMANLQGFATPYRLWGPHDYRLGEHETLNLDRLGDWRPDLILWAESGDGPQGLEGVLDQGVPLAGWLMDSHNPVKLPWHKRVAPLFDYRFCAQRAYCDELDAHWIPFACDPEIHTPTQYSEEYDLAFVGSAYGTGIYSRRYEAMDRLARRYRCNFMSGVYFEDMANAYGSAKIGWHMSVTGQDLDMRVFEVMCSGRMLLTDSAPDSGLDDLFPGEGVPWRYSPEHLMDTPSMLLGNDVALDGFGAAGRAYVLAAHTYRHRARALLAECGL